jgi:hypothetical protein
MAPAIAEQRQHGPDIGRNALHQLWQAVFVGAVHFAQEFILDRAEIVIEGIAA